MMKECPLARSSFEQWSFCQQAIPQIGQTLELVCFEPKAGLRELEWQFRVRICHVLC